MGDTIVEESISKESCDIVDMEFSESCGHADAAGVTNTVRSIIKLADY